MTGHKPWPPSMDKDYVTFSRQYDEKFKSMDRQAAQKRRAKWIKEGLWALAAVLGFVALLMVSGCVSAPSVTPWCADTARTVRLACEAEYGPRRIGVTGYGETVGWQEYCMLASQEAKRRCAR